jgi:protocatechuate 3,4-dioxygenase, beta subunit
MTIAQKAQRAEIMDPPLADSNSAVSTLRVPVQAPLHLPPGWFHTLEGPVFGLDTTRPLDHDLTAHGVSDPIGTRIKLFGRVTDSNGHPVRNALVEVWQANAAGGYRDSQDHSGFALDPNFWGSGRCLTDDQGNYHFITIQPGAYPAQFKDGNRVWRAAHIHLSVYGREIGHRLVTQVYFEGDPLIAYDRMINAIPDRRGQDRLIAKLDMDESVSETLGPPRHFSTLDGSGAMVPPPVRTDPNALLPRNPSLLGYRFDIVLRGSSATPFEPRREA